jgi:hypothetical protein
MEILVHTAEPLLPKYSSFQVEIAIANLRIYTSSGTD